MLIERNRQRGSQWDVNAIGFPTALATAVGLVIGSSILFTATKGFSAGGLMFSIAILIALVIMHCVAASFAELSSILPTAGSVYDYFSVGLGRIPAITGTLTAYLVVHIFAGSAEASLLGVFAAESFEPLSALRDGGSWVIGVSIIWLLAIVNLAGIRLYARVETVMAYSMLGTLLVFGLMGMFLDPMPVVEDLFHETRESSEQLDILSLLGLALYLFVGVEFVTPLAPELKNATRNIPRAMYCGLTIVGILMLLYGASILRQLHNVRSADGLFLLDSPTAVFIYAETVLGPVGRGWLGIALILASATSLNTAMAAVPRILHGMANDGALPSAFRYLHPKYKEPWIGVLVVASIPAGCAILLDGKIDSIIVFILASVCTWLFGYILICLSVISLRIRRPRLVRPYSSPFFPFAQIVAIAGMVVALSQIAPPLMSSTEIYAISGLMMVSCALYAVIWETVIKRRTLEECVMPVDPEAMLYRRS
jgi:amino acid transporter